MDYIYFGTLLYNSPSLVRPSKSQMHPSLLPASFFKVLPLPQKLNRFRISVLNLLFIQQ